MSNYGRRAFCFAGPHVWNSLPEHIRQSTSIAVYKRSLKTFLLQQILHLERIRANNILLFYGLYKCTDDRLITYCSVVKQRSGVRPSVCLFRRAYTESNSSGGSTDAVGVRICSSVRGCQYFLLYTPLLLCKPERKSV